MKYAVIPLIFLGLAIAVLMTSLATSFVFWDWQWFWSTNAGWRLFILLGLVGGGGASSR